MSQIDIGAEKFLSKSFQACRAARRGAVLVYALSCLIMLVSFSLLVTDFARTGAIRAELYDAAEASARYAVTGLADGTYSSRAKAVGAQYTINGSTVTLDDSDIEPGVWNATSRSFTATSNAPNAVRVSAKRTGANGVNTVFGTATGVAASAITRSCIAYFNPNVMLVVGNTTLVASDSAMKTHLTDMGYNVVVMRDASVTKSNAEEMRLVIVSETSMSGNIGSRLRDAMVPVILYEPILIDDMAMTGTTENTDFGCSNIGNRVTISASSHPIAAGFTGTVTVTNLGDTISGAGLAWGVPAPTATIIGYVYGSTTQAAIFAYNAGDVMKNSVVAPAARVSLWGCSPNSAGQGGVSSSTWSTNGWTIFDAAVNWAIGTTPPIRTVAYGH